MTAAAIAPCDLAEAESVLAAAAVHGQTLTFAGGGTERGLGYPLEDVELTLDTKRLSRVVEYAPADMVVEAEAGITLAALQATLAANHQRFALDPPAPERATLGGLLATNAFGPRRTRFGSLRDLIVGVSLVRADGRRVRGGGKVVKNVAGFDLPKIAVGSLGTLGLIATATFRLHPLPAAARLLRVRVAGNGLLRAVVRELGARQLEPSAVAAYGELGASELFVLFEGFETGVAEQAERFVRLGEKFGLTCAHGSGPEELAARDGDVRLHGDVRLRIAMPPAALDALEGDVLAPLAAALDEPRVAVYPTIGVAFVSAVAHDCARADAAISVARATAEARDGNLVVLAAPPSSAVDVYGTLPAAFGLMRELKLRFDPERRLNRGRFVGRL
jgi:glycolate oxidase FAD binding subunit